MTTATHSACASAVHDPHDAAHNRNHGRARSGNHHNAADEHEATATAASASNNHHHHNHNNTHNHNPPPPIVDEFSSPFMCTPHSFPPSPPFRAHVLARSRAFANDVHARAAPLARTGRRRLRVAFQTASHLPMTRDDAPSIYTRAATNDDKQ